MFATTYPWFRLLWFRIILVLITAGSGVFELASGNPGWVFVILAMAGWSSGPCSTPTSPPPRFVQKQIQMGGEE